MATALYRLGRFAARRAWWVVAVWLVIVGVLGGVAMSLPPAPAASMSIPGTEFQTAIDDLKVAMPDTAGASTNVVFSTANGKPFTAAQKKAVAALLKQWKATEEIAKTTNPFTTQAKLDKAVNKIADAKKKLADGRKTITDNVDKLNDASAKIADGEDTLNLNAAKLAEGLKKLNAGQDKLDAGKDTLEANAAKIAAGLAQITQGEAQLADGAAQLAAAQNDLDDQAQQLAAARAQLAQDKSHLAAESDRVDQLAEEKGDDDPDVVAARKQLAQDEADVQATEDKLTGQAAQLDAAQKTLDAKKAELDATAAQLATARAQLEAGQQQIDAARGQLAAGQSTIDTNRAKLADGSVKIADARVQLADAKDQIADGRTKLAKATRKLKDGAADLARGERRLALSKNYRLVSTNGKVALATLSFASTSLDSVPTAFKEQVIVDGASLAGVGVNVDYDDQLVTKSENGSSEAVGIAIAGVVLLVMFGSLLAAGLPLLTAIVGLGVGVLGATVVGAFVPMTSVTTILAVMLGLAVGIDYALFLVNRHRQQLLAGTELAESIGLASGTAGSAVVFAGTTVVVALAALTLTGIPWLGVMGLVAAATVAISVLVSITLTPALLRLIGLRILGRKARRNLAAGIRPAAEDTAVHKGKGKGWGGLVTRHPIVTMLATTVILGILAVPAMSLRLGLPDGSQAAHNSTGYRAYTLVADNFGPGRNGTTVAVATLAADTAKSLSKDELTDLESDIAEGFAHTPGVAMAMSAGHSKDHQTLVFSITPTTGPSEEATTTLVHTLRADRDQIIADNHLTSLKFAGATVANIDIAQRLADALPGYLMVVVGISVALLLLVFRSLLVPIIATVGFLLSVAAAFGASVAVYQWGWLAPVFGVETPAPLLAFLPVLAIGILFGLAMDYQVFMVSGMREAWTQGHDPKTAVRVGFSHGSRVITAAALIMTAVFASFMLSPIAIVKPIGFILTAGVLFDAFVVRMTLVPALMSLAGKAAWYLPGWLDKLLPHLDVEGSTLHRPKPIHPIPTGHLEPVRVVA
ncbi:MAG: MMPL family transporter [Propionibacteriaceae bacterium]|nr:MMPL family transporter [Propionibacteriaceae bacterium]